MKKIKSKGTGKNQTITKEENRKNILKVLIDNEWHNQKEIREKAKITNVTLWQHLKELKPLLEKKIDKKAYPNVLWKINSLFELILRQILTIEISWREIEETHFQGKKYDSIDIKSVLDSINGITNSLLLAEFSVWDLNRNLAKDKEIKLILEIIVWESYKVLTWKFLEAYRKKLIEKKNEED